MRAGTLLQCNRVLGNIGETTLDDVLHGREWDRVEIPWTECGKRFLRKRSRGGRDIGFILPVGTVLRHGDVTYQDSTVILTVEIPLILVLVVHSLNATEFGALAYELGNLHLPVAIDAGEISLAHTEANESLLTRLQALYRIEMRRFEPYACQERINLTIAAGFEILRSLSPELGGEVR